MEEVLLKERFARLQAEFNRKLYNHFVAQRNLANLETDLNRIEAGLVELESLIKEKEQAQRKVAEAKAAEKPAPIRKTGDK